MMIPVPIVWSLYFFILLYSYSYSYSYHLSSLHFSSRLDSSWFGTVLRSWTRPIWRNARIARSLPLVPWSNHTLHPIIRGLEQLRLDDLRTKAHDKPDNNESNEHLDDETTNLTTIKTIKPTDAKDKRINKSLHSSIKVCSMSCVL